MERRVVGGVRSVVVAVVLAVIVGVAVVVGFLSMTNSAEKKSSERNSSLEHSN
jgi:hypothetical protein